MDKPILRIDEARYVLGSTFNSFHYSYKLSKKRFKWNVPLDLQKLARRYKKTFIGFGNWANNDKTFICIANKNISYIETSDLSKLKEWIVTIAINEKDAKDEEGVK